ncbi:hypothetical protein Cs7R123_63450 [Catellatospora sp. TT07R-123]|nr:hypothetical protein Cs7R123_63450 [Catellatospora sp. TT07R-123]
MGAACNDISLALAAAVLDLVRYTDRYELDRASDSETSLGTTEALIAVTASHIDSLTRLYADTAAVYAVWACEVLDETVRRRPIKQPEYLHIAAVDIYLLTGVHLPLVQIPVTGDQRIQQTQLHNNALDATYRLLAAAIDEIRQPANIRRDNDRTKAVTVEPRFAMLLHQYATDCIQALPFAAGLCE